MTQRTPLFRRLAVVKRAAKSPARSFAPTLLLFGVALAGASRLSAQQTPSTPGPRIVCAPEPAAGACWSDYVLVPVDQF